MGFSIRGDGMRLFIAIHLTEEVKVHLSDTISKLSKESVRGNYIREQNLHLTLAFLGDVPSKRIKEILQCMKMATEGKRSFVIKLDGIGKFEHHRESLYWCGIRKNAKLSYLQYALVTILKEHQVAADDKPFKPHITIGRRCIMKPQFDEKTFGKSIPTIGMKVESIHLMSSAQVKGNVYYSSLGEVNLQD